jgi:HD-like signal output (HDOD) protein
MVISGKAIEMMSANARYFIYRKIFEAESGIISESIEKLKQAEDRLRLIASALKKKGFEAHRDLSGFEPVMRILGKIQKLPSSVSTHVGHIGSERTTARELADLVRTDPSMTASVLRIINSSYYSLEKKISDITYAIFYLGIDQILQIVVSQGLKSTLSGNPEFQRLYLHSVIISQISGEIARISGTGQPAVAGTTALLHDLGQNVAFILKEQNPRISELIDLLEPSEMGRLLLESWNMPVFITDTVRYHMYPSFMNPYELPSDIRLAAVSLFVSHLVHDFIHNGSVNDDLMPYVPECLELLGWQEHCVRSLCEKILLPEFERKKSLYPEYFIDFLDRLDIYACSGKSLNDDGF